ncbi:MAG: hydroxyacylglutathione hydrolase [Pseudomonadota bacterium]
MTEIVTIPCLSDNYAYLMYDQPSGRTAVIDVPDEEPILQVLAARGWQLTDILITHHHNDHIDGVSALRHATGAAVWGNSADAARLPKLDNQVAEGDTIEIGALTGQVIDVSGHTIGHVAFYFPGAKAAFTADSLMALGCGRLFEGDAATMWTSLSKLAALPADTLIYSGHEYAASNARFALTIEPSNDALFARAAGIDAARSAGRPTVPVRLDEELATNPFLRANLPEVKSAIGMPGATDVDVFAEIRGRKDRF